MDAIDAHTLRATHGHHRGYSILDDTWTLQGVIEPRGGQTLRVTHGRHEKASILGDTWTP